MAIDNDVLIYNMIPDMYWGQYDIDVWPRPRFEPVSETLINCHIWGYTKYFMEPKLQKLGVKNCRWYKRIQIGVNMIL